MANLKVEDANSLFHQFAVLEDMAIHLEQITVEEKKLHDIKNARFAISVFLDMGLDGISEEEMKESIIEIRTKLIKLQI